MDVIGYIRVSTSEQAQGSSLLSQRKALEAECSRRKWKLVRVIEDSSSGKSLNRPGVQEALSLLGGNALMVSKMDRLSRSVLDVASLLERAKREKWALVALDAPIDTSTAVGEAAANMVATWAQFERRRNGERTSEGIARWKEAHPDRNWGRCSLVPSDVLRTIKNRRRAGHSYGRIASYLNAEGVPTARGGVKWWPSTVRAVAQSGKPGP